MYFLLDHPMVLALASLVLFWASAQVGSRLPLRHRLEGEEKEQYNLVLGATLTLLALIIGFAFSMAVGRYDQRKNYEEEEANAIGTEYLRVDLLPQDDAGKLRPLLKQYLGSRIDFYETRDAEKLRTVDSDTAQLQNRMWSIVAQGSSEHPTPVAALAVSGMNDVINRQGYTQAAWWNRIPLAAWALMGLIAIACNLLIGYTTRYHSAHWPLLILPAVLAIACFLLADLDSPRGGVIRVAPQNLIALLNSLPQ